MIDRLWALNLGFYKETPKFTRCMPSNGECSTARNTWPTCEKIPTLLALLKESFEGHAL
jgi:hypothetical protein